MHPTVSDDLALSIGNQSARLSPGQAFQLAERLIRRATVRMIEEEMGGDDLSPIPAAALSSGPQRR
jgi:hypothetical protein